MYQAGTLRQHHTLPTPTRRVCAGLALSKRRMPAGYIIWIAAKCCDDQIQSNYKQQL